MSTGKLYTGKLIKINNDQYQLFINNDLNFPFATYPHDITKQRLSIDNCNDIANHNINQLAQEYACNVQSNPNSNNTQNIFKDGFNKAIELNKYKLYTTNDLMYIIYIMSLYNLNLNDSIIKFNAMKKSEWNVKIITTNKIKTKNIGAVKGIKGSGSKIKTHHTIPTLDTTKCLILEINNDIIL